MWKNVSLKTVTGVVRREVKEDVPDVASEHAGFASMYTQQTGRIEYSLMVDLTALGY